MPVFPDDESKIILSRVSCFVRMPSRNMDQAAEAGATIYPLIPTFYNLPGSVDDMAKQFACRVLAFIGLPQPDAYQWKGST